MKRNMLKTGMAIAICTLVGLTGCIATTSSVTREDAPSTANEDASSAINGDDSSVTRGHVSSPKGGDGKITKQDRAGGNFNSLVLSEIGEVNIRFADSYSVSVTTDSNMQEHVKTEVRGGALYVDFEQGGINFSKESGNINFSSGPTKLVIDITMPKIQSLEVNGAGKVTLHEGNTDSLQISVSGAGNVDAQNYKVKNAVVDLSGVGSITVWATDSLSGEVSGVGRVLYKGSPKLDMNMSGIGSVDPL